MPLMLLNYCGLNIGINIPLNLFSPGESLDDEYGQEVPVRKPGEKVTGPPILPPHLLQVILNKDIPAHVSNSYNLVTRPLLVLEVSEKCKI